MKKNSLKETSDFATSSHKKKPSFFLDLSGVIPSQSSLRGTGTFKSQTIMIPKRLGINVPTPKENGD